MKEKTCEEKKVKINMYNIWTHTYDSAGEADGKIIRSALTRGINI